MHLRLQDASLKNLRIFEAVVINGGFAAAQTQLGTSAASISVAIKALESQLGIKLCDRGRKGFKLTPRGLAVYKASRKLFESIQDFTLEMSNIREELSGEIRIGLMDNVATNAQFKLSESIHKFNQRDNNVTVILEEAAPRELEARILEGRYHLAIGAGHTQHPRLSYTPLLKEEIAVFCARGHPLFDKQTINTDDINNCKFAGSPTTLPMLTDPNILNQEPASLVENMDATALLLLSGHYIGILPVHYADIWVKRGAMRRLHPINSKEFVEYFLIVQKRSHQPYVAEIFIQELIDVHRDPSE